MKVLIIPDVHGRKFWRQALDVVNDYDKIVFLGDYLDPYYYEDINWEMALSQFKDILKFRSEHLDKVILLCGNHDLHYIVDQDLYCSRYNIKESSKVNELYKGVPFKIAYKLHDCLFTHAGVTKDWLNNYELTVQNLLDYNPESIVMELAAIGRQRGGWEKSGSCMWCDIHEFLYNDHDLGYFQIFGHTQLESAIIHPKEFAAIDCQKCFKLNTKTKEICLV